MHKRFLFLILTLVTLLGVSAFAVTSILAQTAAPSPSVTTEATVAPDSFEMFWPLVAGKTMGDSLYFLKTFKEELRGAIIFGANSKADYEVLLATKRVLETEKLAKEGKMDMSKKTLEAAISKLDNASKNIDTLKSSGGTVDSLEMPDRLTNLVIFSKWLSGKYSDISSLSLQISDKTSALLLKL